MDARDRLSYYKRLMADGVELSAEQKADMSIIVSERGIASAEAMPAGGQKQVDADNTL